MSIRLICSDIDGTLLQYGKKELESDGEYLPALQWKCRFLCP